MILGRKARPGMAPTFQAALGYRLITSVEAVVARWWEENADHFLDVTW